MTLSLLSDLQALASILKVIGTEASRTDSCMRQASQKAAVDKFVILFGWNRQDVNWWGSTKL